MKTIAFDIDGTWTLDPKTFIRVARLFVQAGWRVIFVTGADQPKEKLHGLGIYPYEVITVIGKYKRKGVESAGHRVDVWVDDMPGFIEPSRILNNSPDETL